MSAIKSLIYGRNPVLEALQNEKPLDRILMHHNINGEGIGDIIRLAKQKNVPIVRVPIEKLNTMVKGAHQGILAFGAFVEYVPLQDVISQLYDQGKTPFFVLLEGITDVRNTGAIIRTAVCCGADAVLFTERKSAPLHEDMVKTSAGAMMQITFCRERSIQAICDTLRMNGIKIFSSDLKADKSLLDIDFTGPCCIVMGGEEKGISSNTQSFSDQTFKIPMVGDFDSLNVSVACGIIVFQAMQQRLAAV
ncbi:MAG TPA: 23S rRNA (guanosine(2251)-2'-O)-methyltransferase RlmB [Chitinophagaceae bacterium]|nr:23S rRNA (guanosine(2251)-2'-O)-methyltransferase RlmB [Chitinophagaceae bacterium]